MLGYGVVICFCKVEFFCHPEQGGGVFGQDDGDVEDGGVVDAEFFEKGDVEVGVLRVVDVGIGLGTQGKRDHEEQGEEYGFVHDDGVFRVRNYRVWLLVGVMPG